MIAASFAAGEETRQRLVGHDSLRALFADHTFRGRYADGTLWIEYYAPDGRSAYWDGCTHEGEWWIAEDLVCFHYFGDARDAEYCWYIFRRGERLEFVMSDRSEFGPVGAYTESIERGNAEPLPLDTDNCLSAEARAGPEPAGGR